MPWGDAWDGGPQLHPPRPRDLLPKPSCAACPHEPGAAELARDAGHLECLTSILAAAGRVAKPGLRRRSRSNSSRSSSDDDCSDDAGRGEVAEPWCGLHGCEEDGLGHWTQGSVAAAAAAVAAAAATTTTRASKAQRSIRQRHGKGSLSTTDPAATARVQTKEQGACLRRALRSRRRTVAVVSAIAAPTKTTAAQPKHAVAAAALGRALEQVPAMSRAEADAVRRYFAAAEAERRKGPRPLEAAGQWRVAVRTLEDWRRDAASAGAAARRASELLRASSGREAEAPGMGESPAAAPAPQHAGRDVVPTGSSLHRNSRGGGGGRTVDDRRFRTAEGYIREYRTERSERPPGDSNQPRLSLRAAPRPKPSAEFGAGRSRRSGGAALLMALGSTASRSSLSSEGAEAGRTGRPGRSRSRRSLTAGELLTHPAAAAGTLWREFHHECVGFLKTAPAQRSIDQLKVIELVMRRMSAVKGLSDFVVREVCAAMTYQSVEEHRAVFRQGDPSLAWYIILSGTVLVQVSLSGAVEDSRVVRRMEAGEGFGDLGLLNNKTRSATIVTATRCEFAVVLKEDYNRVLRFMHNKNIAEMANFLKSVPMFADWTTDSRRSIAQFMTFRSVAPGSMIIQEGAKCDELFFVRRGSVELFKSVPREGVQHKPAGAGNDTRLVHVETREPGDYFCEECIVRGFGVSAIDGGGARALFTVRAGKTALDPDAGPAAAADGPRSHAVKAGGRQVAAPGAAPPASTAARLFLTKAEEDAEDTGIARWPRRLVVRVSRNTGDDRWTHGRGGAAANGAVSDEDEDDDGAGKGRGTAGGATSATGTVLAVITAFDARQWIQNIVKPHGTLGMDTAAALEVERRAGERRLWGRFKHAQVQALLKAANKLPT
ncbi:hypothetical protein HK405_006566 [Cladochytrium tenue]|nr:hypothetical protein HK405_006566 [Cladochytrium tenue]